jgi:integrase
MTEQPRRFSFSKKTLDCLQPDDRNLWVFDDRVSGLSLLVTPKGTKTFYLYKRLSKGAPKQIKIGRYPDLSIDLARKKAQELLGQMAQGLDPVKVERAATHQFLKLGEVYDDYVISRRPQLKENTLRDYAKVKRYIQPWLNEYYTCVVKTTVADIYANLLDKHGVAQSALAMRCLRAVGNFASQKYDNFDGQPVFPSNPFSRFMGQRTVQQVKPRTGKIAEHELSTFVRAVLDLDSETARDYYLLLLLTGMRKNEAASLRWSDIQFSAKTLTAKDTKNGSDHTLPLTHYVFDLLATRRKADPLGEFVFPAPSTTGFITDLRKQQAKIEAALGRKFQLHDLRRSYATHGEAIELSPYVLKRLLNHTLGQDVTGKHYLAFSPERLRRAGQQIEDYILRHAGLKPSAEIVRLSDRAEQRSL